VHRVFSRNDLTEFMQTLGVRPTHCVVEEAEVVAFDERLECSGGVYALRGRKAPDPG
jgi:hypothetical protein